MVEALEEYDATRPDAPPGVLAQHWAAADAEEERSGCRVPSGAAGSGMRSRSKAPCPTPIHGTHRSCGSNPPRRSAATPGPGRPRPRRSCRSRARRAAEQQPVVAVVEGHALVVVAVVDQHVEAPRHRHGHLLQLGVGVPGPALTSGHVIEPVRPAPLERHVLAALSTKVEVAATLLHDREVDEAPSRPVRVAACAPRLPPGTGLVASPLCMRQRADARPDRRP
jgi:hypothetical protein